MDKHQKVIEYCTFAIELSQKSNTSDYLALLLTRKSIAEFLLNDSEYIASYKKAIYFSKIANDPEMIKIINDVFYKHYGIKIEFDDF